MLNRIKTYLRSLARRGDIGSLRDAVWHLYNVRKKDAYILKNAIGHLCVQDLRRRKDLIQNINDTEFWRLVNSFVSHNKISC